MSEKSMAAVIDQFRMNLGNAGLVLSEADFGKIEAEGYLKPVLAFERAIGDRPHDQAPDYLGPWTCLPADSALELPEPVSSFLPEPASRGGSSPLDLDLMAASSALRSGELSPLDLAKASLARVGERNPDINAFQLLLEDEALEAARRAEAEIRSGKWRGPLHGIPVAVKDLLDLAGHPTTAGSIILADGTASTDSVAVARLRAAGAIIIGKTRMSEFAYSPGSNNDHFGPTRNPRAPGRDSGGSSSGSAAATADRMVYAAVGTDTGGSIRIPSAFCGLVGLKPTYGRLSLRGAVPLSWSLDHLGPIARTVSDLAALFDALEGYSPGDASGMPPGGSRNLVAALAAARRGRAGLAGLRIGVLGDDGSGRPLADADCLSAWKRGLNALVAAGASLVDIDLPSLQGLRTLNGALLAIEAAVFHLPTLKNRLADYGDFMRLRILGGFAYGPLDLVRIQQARAGLRKSCDAIFDTVDILSTPTMSQVAPLLGTPPRLTLVAPFNILGWPALTLPVGTSSEGHPLGMQLVGRPWHEATLLRAARAAELALGHVTQSTLLSLTGIQSGI
ncbi:MAG: amidase [Rectinemataceae bacterium]